MRCATKTLSNSTSTSSGAVLCRRRRRFPLFLFLLLNEWMKNITRFDSLLFIWTPFYVLCAFFFWHLIFLKNFWRSLKFEFLKIPHFFAKKTSQNQNRFRPSSSRVRWWWFGRLLRGSESQNAFDRWSSLKGRLSKSVRLRRGCCVGGDALVVLVVLVVFSARFFFVCVRAPLSIEEEK